ncbi:MAG: glycine cleavage system aminomethyltransferase GcvT [Myxococcota bacterium]|nr:glycine cleavage system aminomethyltransferase GcvT [Myxococcota bacterium]
MSETRRTPLYARHVELGARMVDFAGFAMPVQYDSIKNEHRAVRETAGLFDVSHMGQIHLSGKTALESAQRLLTCRVDTLEVGQVRYGLLCNSDGGCVDDVTVYREGPSEFMLCVNASNIEKDRDWIRDGLVPGSEIRDRSSETGLLAIQGPKSAELLDRLCHAGEEPNPSALGRFRFSAYTTQAGPVLISRTGYTGSDGFEIYLPAEVSRALFDLLLETGQADGLVPAGLGARDTLRLEAALPLYGHELDDTTSPLEAGLARFVKRKQGGFIGHEAIEAREKQGRSRQLVGFELLERGIARADYPIVSGGRQVGRVTSGAPSPSLGTSIGLGYVPPENAAPGTELAIEIRKKNVKARIVTTPFSKNS